MEALGVVLSWLDLGWVAGQISEGNGVPLFIWSLVVAVICFMVGYAIGKKRAGYRPKWAIARCLDTESKKAAALALESDKFIPLGENWQGVATFNRAHPGVFAINDPDGYIGSGTEYQLNGEWSRYLRKHEKYLR